MTVLFHDTLGTITGYEFLAESAYLDYRREYAVIEIPRPHRAPRVVRIPVDSIGGLRGGERITDYGSGCWTGVFGKGAA